MKYLIRMVLVVLLMSSLSACSHHTMTDNTAAVNASIDSSKNTSPTVTSPGQQKDAMIGSMAGGVVGAGAAMLTGNPYLMAAILVPTGSAIGYYVPKVNSSTQAISLIDGQIFQVGDYVSLVLPSDAIFDTNTADFAPAAPAVLNEVAGIIADFPKSQVLVTSNTDNIGSDLAQAKLSRKQARAVALQLWEDPRIDFKTFDRFQFVGMGSTKPIADNNTMTGQALNRRVQITIYPKQLSKQFAQAMDQYDMSSVAN